MTKIIDLKKDDNYNIEECAKCVKNGGVIIFPTETVYGIGTNALDKEAVDKIFTVKGRKSDNPLIVLVSNTLMLDKIVCNINEIHKKLMEEFWPGPLTIIFDKKDVLPDNVTGGLNTVGVRIPGNSIARNLIEKIGVPITAPSANISGKLSIVDANIAYSEFCGKVDYIIDGGISDIGIESTIVKVENGIVKILRCGSILKEDIEKLGIKVEFSSVPSLKNKHYDIGSEAIIVTGEDEEITQKIDEYLTYDIDKKVGIIGSCKNYDIFSSKVDKYIKLEDDNNSNMKNLFSILNEAREADVDVFLIEEIKNTGSGKVIMNKLMQVSDNKII